MRHGTHHAYYRRRCRCAVCVEAAAQLKEEARQRAALRRKAAGASKRKPAMAASEKRRRNAERLRRSTAYINKRKQEEGPCVRCGSDEDLEFDHIDPSTKRINVSRMRGFAIETIEAEIAKCQVLCKQCHIEKTLEDKARLAWV